MPVLVVATLLLAACGSDTPMTSEEYRTIPLRLPNGKTIRVETAIGRLEVARGLRFRPSLAQDRGVLLWYGSEDSYPFQSFQVEIRLDVLWMDKNHKIVQLLYNTPACAGPREACLQYGGAFPAQFVLALPAGAAKRYGLRHGMTLDF
jgi:uncharacterized membrane protein (UPF0127 family)